LVCLQQEGGGACPDNGSQAAQQARGVCEKGGGKGWGKVVEQQLGALGNPCPSFSSPSALLCIRRGFDEIFTLGDAIQDLSNDATVTPPPLFSHLSIPLKIQGKRVDKHEALEVWNTLSFMHMFETVKKTVFSRLFSSALHNDNTYMCRTSKVVESF
jgi:hypothetical protein